MTLSPMTRNLDLILKVMETMRDFLFVSSLDNLNDLKEQFHSLGR